MNDPNKAINVNLSSLLSLKAELLRKQNEVKVAKERNVGIEDFVPSRNKTNETSAATENKSKTKIKEVSRSNDAKVYEIEDSAQLEKSRRVLEAKSKYYERMSRAGGALNSDDNCLVMFNRKLQDEKPAADLAEATNTRYSSSSESDEQNDIEHDDDDDDDDDWVEFTDCLGRTRKCLRKDLAASKQRDKQLAESMPERLDQSKANWMIDTKGARNNSDNDEDDDDMHGPRPTESICSEGLSTMSKLEEQRVNWERKEQENFDKPDVHYQDVFFDEARQHGVGYFAFSTDEAERKKQQKELDTARKATLIAQKKSNALRAERDRLVMERVFSAKNRIRARNGLTPLTREEFEAEYNKPKEHEVQAKKLAEKTRKRDAKLERQKEIEEKEREQQRLEHVRPWDKEKVGATIHTNAEADEEFEEWQYKAERVPMSQEEWNEKQRAVRQPEFAPMPEANDYVPKRTNFTSMPPPIIPMPTTKTEFTTFQSTKRERTFQRRNYTKEEQPEKADNAPSTSQRGAAIPPPANLGRDYAPKRAKTNDDLSSTIEAGLRFLREQSDRKQASSGGKSSWAAKADY